MTKKKNKRKNRGSSGSNSDSTQNKVLKTGGPDGDADFSISDVLSRTNSVLYDADENYDGDTSAVFRPHGNSVTQTYPSDSKPDSNSAELKSKRATNEPKQPSNADIMRCLEKIDSRLDSMDTKIGGLERRLSALEVVKDKVESCDRELLWNVLEDRQKKTVERIRNVEEKVDSQDFASVLLHDKVVSLEKEKDVLKDEVVYLQSQSMRNNLVFSNIPEARGETSEDAEKEVRQFISDKMKVAKDLVDKISFDIVHRMGGHVQGKHRRIVAKFHDYKDKEFVRKQSKALHGTSFYVSEQFPKEIVDKRRKLVPRMKAARQENKKAWIAYDTLYVDGRAVRD